MALFSFLRRKPPVRDAAALADFIDSQSAFLVQKGIFEYARARAGHYAKVLFHEPDFQAAVEAARWRAYPLGLAMVVEMVEGELRPHAAGHLAGVRAALTGTALAVFDRYPAPPSLGPEAWAAARDDVAHVVERCALHPVKRVIDVPEPYMKPYFALMPIHPKLRGQDFDTTCNYLRVGLCNIHDELAERLDADAVTAALLRGGG
ncbi:hypothetical protein PQJ75_06710 [Rhodoplanes sp. TEM]|uniref:Decarboxylase n=1 Tax=Rhodoplanes tepidamans TaxID=200616 RepID=A0ABT5JH40_RHOTP|nr:MULTISPECIES: hypothetical protein [Rhodoplanes]MDC7788733.1 hypothetical protein [Rhodoplanes tepidamans]MDC7983418.1 hypothetical protein [Rhodoplanes sp. TEM]MDQ0354554.1 hypothetical protein [Rhodoplanes tepidamans]